MDFSQDELLEAVERLVNGLLERAGVTEPPVNALRVAEEHLGIPVEVVEPAEEDENGRRRPRSRHNSSGGITLTDDMTETQRQKAAADGIARTVLPDILRKLGVMPGSEDKQFVNHVRGLVIPRVLIPTRLLRVALKEHKYDVPALGAAFATAPVEMVALRLLDLDEPCVISIIDDGVVSVRRGNRSPEGKKLSDPEQQCHDRVAELELPHRVRADVWTVQGWHIPDRPFRRIILRTVRDEAV